jgi:hypothetical protein
MMIENKLFLWAESNRPENRLGLFCTLIVLCCDAAAIFGFFAGATRTGIVSADLFGV